jgi:hypothetical protein
MARETVLTPEGLEELKAKIDDLVFAITPDASVRWAKLQKGECHVMPYPNAADVEGMKANPDLQVMEQEGLNIAYLAYNTTQAPFDKPHSLLADFAFKRTFLKMKRDIQGTHQKALQINLDPRRYGTFAEIAHYAGVEASDW